MNWLKVATLTLGLSITGLASAEGPAPAPNDSTADWPYAGGTIGGQRYSPLTQIGKDNAKKLKVAWVFHTGDFAVGDPQAGKATTAFELAPLEIDGTLYVCTPKASVIALDPETGKQKWRFDPNPKPDETGVYEAVCRGVGYWKDATAAEGTACRERIYVGTLDARLISMDAKTGKPCDGFGKQGTIDLREGLGDVRVGEYYMTSPVLIINDLALMSAFVKDVQRIDAPSGAVRAFDARTGELKWAWDAAPPSKTPVSAIDVREGKAVLTRGTPNTWGIMSADAERGLVFLGTGNPLDHYSGRERGDLDYYGSSIIALDAGTGKLQWHFQTVHHDLWDYDIGAQPVTYEHRGAGGPVPAVVGATKMGFLFLLNRLDGTPIFPVEERPVPNKSTVPGEMPSPTQPFPTKPEPLLPPTLTHDTVWGLTPVDRAECRKKFDALDYQGIYTPPSERGILEYPGLGGGINWGSVSIDPVRNRMIVNLQMAPFYIKIVPREKIHPDQKLSSDLVGFGPMEGTPYIAARGPFVSSWGMPCVPPPWGRLVAIDLNTGNKLWDEPLGNLNSLSPVPVVGNFFHWGTPNLGGSLQTASGLVFIGATMDKYFRAIDGDTGKELWRYELPYAAQSTPITFKLKPDGKQYIVVAAGGHGALGVEPGDAVIAFTLSD